MAKQQTGKYGRYHQQRLEASFQPNTYIMTAYIRNLVAEYISNLGVQYMRVWDRKLVRYLTEKNSKHTRD